MVPLLPPPSPGQGVWQPRPESIRENAHIACGACAVDAGALLMRGLALPRALASVTRSGRPWSRPWCSVVWGVAGDGRTDGRAGGRAGAPAGGGACGRAGSLEAVLG